MTVATPVLPDRSTQEGTSYCANIDASIKVLSETGFSSACHEQSTPNMTVRIESLRIIGDGEVTEVAAQNSGTITAPSSNPRIDIVCIERLTGDVFVISGKEASSPVAPNIPWTGYPIAQIALQTTTTSITNSIITDIRSYSDSLGHKQDAVLRSFKSVLVEADVTLGSTDIGKDVNTVTHGPEGFVAAGAPNGVTECGVYRSVNGTDWQRITGVTPYETIEASCYGNGLYVLTGYSRFFTSPDGVTWTARTMPKSFYAKDIIWCDALSLFVAVGDADGTDAYLVTSPDGITWTERSNPKNIHLLGITYGNGVLVAVGLYDGTDAYFITSPDGITWTERSNPHTTASTNMKAVVYTGKEFIAIQDSKTGTTSGNDVPLSYSTDGISWTKYDATGLDNLVLTLGHVEFFDGVIFVIGPIGGAAHDKWGWASTDFRTFFPVIEDRKMDFYKPMAFTRDPQGGFVFVGEPITDTSNSGLWRSSC